MRRASNVGSLSGLGRAACLLLVFAFAACASEGPVEDYEVSGYITDRGTGAGISGATVTFVSDTLYAVATTTDEDGLYQMAVETDRPFGQITANAAGYGTNDATVFFDARTRRVDITLRAE